MANTHTATVTLEPDPAKFACNDEVEFTVTIKHTGGDPIKEVRIYDGPFNSLYLITPPNTDFVCGAPPIGWTLVDQITTFNYCQYQALLPDTEFKDGDTEVFTFKAKLTTESNYAWGVETYDIKLSWLSHVLPVTVDCTAPTTMKDFDGPFNPVGDVEWIDGVTKIFLDAEDDVEHNSGVDKTWYKNVLLQDENACRNSDYCYYSYELDHDTECINDVQEDCEDFDVSVYDDWYECVENEVEDGCDLDGWKLYDGTPIEKDEESCHALYFFSVDNVGNIEDVNANCFFVDLTPPEVSKEHGENAIVGDDPNPPISGEFHWVNPDTDITFNCEDQQPHPSGMEELCFKVSYDLAPFDLTNLYCEKYKGNLEDSYCCVPATPINPFVFNFNKNEDSIHDLEYYCKDAVDKKTETFLQWYKVDDTPPSITKEMFGSWLGDCPPLKEGDECYVADDGTSGVNIWVEDVGPVCAVNDVNCNYELWWEGALVGSRTFTDHQNIIFKEDSTHILKISCTDALGNEVKDEEEFLVDSNPPTTTKMYGEPQKIDPLCWDRVLTQCQDNLECANDLAHKECKIWITSDTPVDLWAKDEKVGVDKIFWRNQIVPDWYCEYPIQSCLPCEETDLCNPALPFNEVDVDGNEVHTTFYKEQESCHLIEYYSVDELGNVEPRNHQCVFVDNTPPEPVKEIGEHKLLICPDDGNHPEGDFSVNSVGDVVHTIDVSLLANPGYTNFCSVGLAFDGVSLYYNRCTDQNIYKIDPITGALQDTFNTGVNYPNAMAYDAKRNGIWFGSQACDEGNMPIYFWDFDDNSVSVEFTIFSSLINPATSQSFLSFCFVDGLAYNENDPDTDADDEIWFSDDVNRNLGLFRPDGTFVTGYDASTIDISLLTLSGLAIGGPNLYLGNDGGGDVFRADKDDLSFIDEFASTSDRVEDMECDPVTFAPTEVMWVRHTPQGDLTKDKITAHEIEPGTCGFGGQQCPNPDIYVTPDIPIWLSCKDPEPHPVDQETLCYKVSLHNGQEFGDITPKYCEELNQDGWCCEYVGDKPFEFHFKEESEHDLEYFCEDHLGNKGEEHIQFYFVDVKPPITTKTYEGPFYIDASGKEYIDTATKVVLKAEDQEPHPSGVHKTYWKNILVDNSYCESKEICGQWQPSRPEDEGWNIYTGPFSKDKESCHIIEYYSADNLWNTEDVKWQCVFVDKKPPVITKEFDGHHFTCFDWCEEEGLDYNECLEICDFDEETNEWFPQWITSETEILISAEDPLPHPSGVKKVEYRKTLLVDDEACKDIDICQGLTGTGPFNPLPLVDGSCTIDEESCHLIEIEATDNVGKKSLHKQCVFVDNSPPKTNKTVGEPKIKWNGTDSIFYPEETKHCWDDETGEEIECWKVTIMTPITLDCNDPEPHPVDHERICFMVDLDGEDVTEDYCNDYSGDYNESGNGFCCLDQTIEDFTFLEESEHNLKFYCEDALGNSNEEDIDEEKFKVFGKMFEIDLNKKWNLISVPFDPLDKDVEKVFEEVAENVNSVVTYDGEVDHWFTYRPDGEGPNDLDVIETGLGYWVLALNDDTLVVGGSLYNPGPVTPPSRKLSDGWNLIGYYGAEDEDGFFSPEGPVPGDGKNAYCALYSLRNLDGGLSKPSNWNSLLTYWELDNPNQFKELGLCDEMDPGAGYWIAMDTEDTYNPQTVCDDNILNLICDII